MKITRNDIIQLRLQNHFSGKADTPAAAVQWMGATQAQEYDQAKWAIGSRIQESTLTDIEKAIKNKRILRTWLFRGTLHFVHKNDVHGLLRLIAPALMQKLKTRHTQLSLKESQFDKFNLLLTECLKGGKELPRTELSTIFKQKGVDATGERLYHILLRAGLDQVICCGAKKDTFRLLENGKSKKSNDQVLKEIAKRYFFSHGPATDNDFATWAGITLKDARNAIAANSRVLQKLAFNDKIYWCSREKLNTAKKPPECLLLAGFDEYYLGYKDKDIPADDQHTQQIVHKNGIFNPSVVLNGKIEGVWKRIHQKEKVIIEISPFRKFNKHQKELIAAAADRFGRFLNKPHELKL